MIRTTKPEARLIAEINNNSTTYYIYAIIGLIPLDVQRK
jgi:hypothetical protein